MVIYLDAAALVKLVREEPGSAQLRVWLKDRFDLPRVTSVMVEVEVPRAVRRATPSLLLRVPRVLAAVTRVDCDPEVRAAAARLEEPTLRSLDAVHLATAMEFGSQLTAFVTYDRRLLAAAEAVGLPVSSPGA